MVDDHSFGYWVRRRRMALDLTQKALGLRVGCSVAMIRKIEADERRPSLRVAERLADILQLSADKRERFLQIARGDLATDWLAPEPASDSPRLSVLRPRLPQPLTSFVGREHDLARTLLLLRRSDVRLLIISGPPGVGKTRLAIQLAAAAQADFASGAAFVALADVQDPALIVPTIIKALELPVASRQTPLELLSGFLQTSSLLLVLDNLEQIAAAPELAALLAAAPLVKLLVTSQTALPLMAGHEYPLAPLPVPDHLHLTLEQLAQIPAVALFVQRAQAIQPAFTLVPEIASAVAELCIRLDGLPLAIELAAARSKLFPPQVLLGRIDQRLSLLVSSGVDLPPRHRSLRAAIDWSYQQLTVPEQELFARLSVFVNGCAVEAVAAVCQGVVVADLLLIENIELLIANSLLSQRNVDGELRLSMLESLRVYALERLEQRAELAVMQHRHARYYLQLVESADLIGPEQAAWVRRLDLEHDNLRAALSWALESGDQELALRLGAVLWRFWHRRGYRAEGRRWLDAILGRYGTEQAETNRQLALCLAQVLIGAGLLADEQADYQYALNCYQRGLRLFQTLNDQHGVADAYSCLGIVALDQLDYATATTYFVESTARYRQFGNRRGIATNLLNMGIIAQEQNDFEHARTCYLECLQLCRQLGDTYRISVTVGNLGLLAYGRGEDTAAQRWLEESLAICRELRDIQGVAHALTNLAWVALRQGALAQSASFIAEALQLFRELNDLRGVGECLDALAGVAVATGADERAARLYGAADQLYLDHAITLPPDEQSRRQAICNQVQQRIGTESWAILWELGRTLSLAQVLVLAMEQR